MTSPAPPPIRLGDPPSALLCAWLAADPAAPPPDLGPALAACDPAAVTAAALHHRLESAAIRQAERLPGLLPPPLAEALESAARAALVRGMTQAATAARLSRGLEAADIPVLLLKGCALSQVLHGAPFRRVSRDIDLLVAPEDQARAVTVLEALGCRPFATWQPYADPGAPVGLHAPGGSLVDLHSGLAPAEALLPLAVLRPFAIAVPVAVGGATLRTLPAEAAVVYAAQHGCKHLWRRLGWLYDIAVALRPPPHGPGMDWAAALALAERLGAERSLLVAAELAAALFAAPRPAALAGHPQRPAALEAVRGLAPLLAAPPAGSDIAAVRTIGRLRYLVWENRLHRGWRRRWAALRVHARPSPTDVRALPWRVASPLVYIPLRLIRVLAAEWRDRRG